MSQPLFGNKFVSTYVRRKKRVLFLRNWIRGGIRKVGDLVFSNDILDKRSLYHKLTVRQNIYCDIMLVKNGIVALPAMLNGKEIMIPLFFNRIKLHKSKDFYSMFKFQSTPKANIARIRNYLVPLCNNDEEVSVFTKKVALVREIKLKEFNFKVLHGILPCNLNLMQWKIRDSHKCDICGES